MMGMHSHTPETEQCQALNEVFAAKWSVCYPSHPGAFLSHSEAAHFYILPVFGSEWLKNCNFWFPLETWINVLSAFKAVFECLIRWKSHSWFLCKTRSCNFSTFSAISLTEAAHKLVLPSASEGGAVSSDRLSHMWPTADQNITKHYSPVYFTDTRCFPTTLSLRSCILFIGKRTNFWDDKLSRVFPRALGLSQVSHGLVE